VDRLSNELVLALEGHLVEAGLGAEPSFSHRHVPQDFPLCVDEPGARGARSGDSSTFKHGVGSRCGEGAMRKSDLAVVTLNLVFADRASTTWGVRERVGLTEGETCVEARAESERLGCSREVGGSPHVNSLAQTGNDRHLEFERVGELRLRKNALPNLDDHRQFSDRVSLDVVERQLVA